MGLCCFCVQYSHRVNLLLPYQGVLRFVYDTSCLVHCFSISRRVDYWPSCYNLFSSVLFTVYLLASPPLSPFSSPRVTRLVAHHLSPLPFVYFTVPSIASLLSPPSKVISATLIPHGHPQRCGTKPRRSLLSSATRCGTQ